MPDVPEGHDTPRPSTYLVIPYLPGDRGAPGTDRPVHAPAIWWLCPSLHVTGTPGPGVFEPGKPMNITVDVANFGTGTGAAVVSVVVWWSRPSTAFTELHWFGQDVIAVPSHGAVASTRPMTGAIPVDAPPHVCLLARATALASPLPPGGVADPINDAHWAQHNLDAVTVPAGQPDFPFRFAWSAGNPGADPARYQVSARPSGPRTLEALAEMFRAHPVRDADLRLLIGDAEGPQSLELPGGAQQDMLLSGVLGTPLEPGTFTAIDIVQVDVTDEQRMVGAVGLVLVADR
ncbi:MAG: hypothetical protein HOV94_05515 [Saccharothrix sp.]|nr:hypothetical protein [Saccharothrix sp.]